MPEPAAPATGVPPGPLAFGGAPLGNMFAELSEEDAFAALEDAWAAGIRYFDTAPHYGVGLSERRMGAFLRTKPRDEFMLSTKVGRLLVPDPGADGRDDEGFDVPATTKRRWAFGADDVRRSLDESLERLGLDRVDILYIHDPERSDTGLDAALATAIPAVAALRDEGVVGRVGIGTMVNEAVVTAVRTGALDLAMIANRLTLADHSALEAAVPACREHGVGVVAAAPFNSGLLAHSEPRGHFDYQDVPSEVLDRVRRIAAICREHGVELPTAALHYPLRFGAETVVVGARRAGQMAENRRRLETPVPEELWSALAARGLIAA
ncbi:aldo/keto reductase [Gryllotalpicola daejeonensis]|uniref:Aldo/keto reductase n=1 Tax=Gryllotalpicola daejeonensis TaxID=993087 RepID=A0ABP7ZKR7_9MICO